MSQPMSSMSGREALEGAEVQVLDLIFEGMTPKQWAELLKAPLKRAAAKGERGLTQKLIGAGAEIGDALHEAVRGGHRETVNGLLESGASLDAKDKNGGTPLHAAAHGGETEMVQLLLHKGADKDACDNQEMTALFRAAGRGHVAVVLALLAAGVDVSLRCGQFETPAMHEAAKEGRVEILRAFIEHGADVDAVNTDGCTALNVATWDNNPKTIDVLAEAGANIEARNDLGGTPLHDAASGPNREALLCLLKHGADVDAVDTDGFTALHVAARDNNPKTIDVLAEAGANIEARNNLGGTPLHDAASGRNREALLCLLKHGVVVNAQNDFLQTPLVIAATLTGKPGAAEVVDSLLRAGADEALVDDTGSKAADLIGAYVAEERRLAEDVERVRQLLANAPADRAWRRRGYLVLCRAHPDRVQQNLASSGTHHTDTGQRTRSCAKSARAEGMVGDSTMHEIDGDDWTVVAAKVVGLREEGIFRTIVGYL